MTNFNYKKVQAYWRTVLIQNIFIRNNFSVNNDKKPSNMKTNYDITEIFITVLLKFLADLY